MKEHKKSQNKTEKLINNIVTYDLLALSLRLFDEHDDNYLPDVTKWFYIQYSRSTINPVPFEQISDRLRENLEILLFTK